MSGDSGTDHTEAMARLMAKYFPPAPASAPGAPTEWTTGPVAYWNGPTDDNELIDRARKSLSARAAFGGKASFADLWDGNAQALAKAFPAESSSSEPYNASSADMALACHLMFWTGRDCERAERLMRRSALVRPKWDDRADYLRGRTIMNALRRSREVLTAHKKESPGADGAQCTLAGPELPTVPSGQTVIGGIDTVELIDGASVVPEAVQWLWDGFLACGKLHVLAGAPGTGKTMIALALATTISTGGRWPDGTGCEPGNVLIWSAEDDIADTLVPRLIAMGANMHSIRFVGDKSTMAGRESFDPAHDMPLLLRTVAAWSDIKLLIVDPIVSAVAGDSHKNAETRRGLQPLVEVGHKLNAAVLGISHFSKGTAGRDVTERVTGSLAFGALARVVLAAAKRVDDDGGGRILARAKSNIGPDGGGFSYDLAPGVVAGYPQIKVHVLQWGSAIEGSARDLLATADDNGGPEVRTAVDDAKEFLRDLLVAGPVSAKMVRGDAEGVGHAWNTVRKAQKALGVEAVKEGMKGGWVWKLPAKMPTKTEDAHQKSVSAFENVEHLRESTASALCRANDD